ncbi:MAG: chromosome partitioning protein [Alphaproteobacteria bacterium]|jgi:cellulose biosynthesis protein BcsQ|nr:chromosome partitioning protein [Alphaproteobacteria bacterium]
MNVITLASRKGGAGKTTLTAHLAAHAHSLGLRCLAIDADPQGSLALCNALRAGDALPFATAERGIDRALALAMASGVEWVFIDTAPTMWVVVQEAIRAATLVLIPARPGFLDLDAVRETVKTARERNRPYAVVLNAAPAKRDDKEAPAVLQSRAWLDTQAIPVWSGQISQRAGFVLTLAAGASASEVDSGSLAAAEIARLWSAVERSVEAVNAARPQAGALAQGRAA